MSDLLGIGAAGVNAYRTALNVVGENVTNAETKGYSRRSVAINESPTGTSTSPFYRNAVSFGGSASGAVIRAWDDYKASDARDASADSGRADARANWLSANETALADGDAGIGARVTAVFTQLTQLAADPSSGLQRSSTLTTLGDATDAIAGAATALAKVSGGIADEARATVGSINDDLTRLADLNRALIRTADGSSAKAGLADARDQLLADLSAKVGIDAKVAGDGSVAVTLAGASDATLVSGTTAASLGLTVAIDGRLSTTLNLPDGAHAVSPSGGSLAGLADAAAMTAGNRATLNGVATDFATKLNAWNAAGTTAAGAAGPPLVAIGLDAATLALATTDPSAIAAAKGGATNGNLLALDSLRGPDGAEQRLGTLVSINAQALSAAKSQASAAATRKDAAFTAQGDATGVDLDREAADLMRYQQAYDGSAKIIQAARETLQSILSLF